MSNPNGGPAFPVPGLQDHEEFNGMQLRDYFAAKAMQALIGQISITYTPSRVIEDSFTFADQMLKERAK